MKTVFYHFYINKPPIYLTKHAHYTTNIHIHFEHGTCCLENFRSRTANVDLLKMVHVEILFNFGNYFRTLQLGFGKFLSGIVFLHHYVRTIGLLFSQANSI